jgi:hypothetical protein
MPRRWHITRAKLWRGEMPDLTLERASDGSDHYEVLDDARNVVGHIRDAAMEAFARHPE